MKLKGKNGKKFTATPYVQLGAKDSRGRIVTAENYKLNELYGMTWLHRHTYTFDITVWDKLTGAAKWKRRHNAIVADILEMQDMWVMAIQKDYYNES